mmetsp:Transcript_11689/g.29530  ORF Transcript_11689/g.29530 Transcript_11689/m.29530 type:complete len:90 (+) Transcript_11689:110-379(+)
MFARSVSKTTPHQQRVLRIYTSLLRELKFYPSLKRDNLIEDVKLEFRENATLADETKIEALLAQAERALVDIRKYSSLPESESSWTVRL